MRWCEKITFVAKHCNVKLLYKLNAKGNKIRKFVILLHCILFQNTSDSNRTAYLVLSAASEFYTGVKAQAIKRAEGEFKIAPGECKSIYFE